MPLRLQIAVEAESTKYLHAGVVQALDRIARGEASGNFMQTKNRGQVWFSTVKSEETSPAAPPEPPLLPEPISPAPVATQASVFEPEADREARDEELNQLNPEHEPEPEIDVQVEEPELPEAVEPQEPEV